MSVVKIVHQVAADVGEPSLERGDFLEIFHLQCEPVAGMRRCQTPPVTDEQSARFGTKEGRLFGIIGNDWGMPGGQWLWMMPVNSFQAW